MEYFENVDDDDDDEFDGDIPHDRSKKNSVQKYIERNTIRHMLLKLNDDVDNDSDADNNLKLGRNEYG